MKYFQTFEKFLSESFALNEIGDAMPLDWEFVKKVNKEFFYEFMLGPELYQVLITQLDTNKINVDFSVDGDREIVTDSGFPFTVFATVISVIKDHLSKNPAIDTIVFVPTMNFPDDHRRLRIYIRYAEKLFPNATIEKETAPSGHIGVEIKLK